MRHCVQAAWLQLTDTSSAGVVAAELAFLGAQLAEVPTLEQLDAMQGSRAGSLPLTSWKLQMRRSTALQKPAEQPPAPA